VSSPGVDVNKAMATEGLNSEERPGVHPNPPQPVSQHAPVANTCFRSPFGDVPSGGQSPEADGLNPLSHTMEGASSHCDPKSTSKPVHILYYNARSLLPKFDELCAVAEATCPDVICIVESWLSDEISDNELAIDNYQSLRLNRNRHGGGVVMYIHSSLSHQVLSAGANNLELLIGLCMINFVSAFLSSSFF